MLVYGLWTGDACFYVGRTRVGTKARLLDHEQKARLGSGQPVHREMRRIWSAGGEVSIRALALNCGMEAEREWIERLIGEGHLLANLQLVPASIIVRLQRKRGERDEPEAFEQLRHERDEWRFWALEREEQLRAAQRVLRDLCMWKNLGLPAVKMKRAFIWDRVRLHAYRTWRPYPKERR